MMKTYKITEFRLAFLMRAVLMLAFGGTSVMAATCTWDGSESGSWINSLNWDVAPVNSDNLIFPAGALNQSNTNDAGITYFTDLTLGSSGWSINLGSAHFRNKIYVTGSSTLNGNTAGYRYSGTVGIEFSGTGDTLGITGNLDLARIDGQKLTVSGAGNTLTVGSLSMSTAKNQTYEINAIADVIVNGGVSGNRTGSNLKKSGIGTLTVNGVSTYNFNTSLTDGTLALGSGASISNITSLSISAGATFDVSAQSAYALDYPLTAGGATSPATIKGASAGTVSLGGQAVTFNWSGASSGVDSSNAPLTIADATLVLNNEPMTINVTGAALGEGTYTLIDAPVGISGSIYSTPVYSGNGISTNLPESANDVISISGNSVILTIASPPSGPVFSIR